MISLLEIQHRSLTGPVMKEDDFNLAVAFKSREVVKKHGIKYNPDELIVSDETGDLIFAAAVDMLTDVGMFNKDSHRVVKLTREEVLQVAKDRVDGSPTATIGRNSDEFVIRRRTPGDGQPVATLFAASVSDVPDEMYIPYVKSFAKEESCQGFAGMPASLGSVEGLTPKSGAPSEAVVANAELQMTLEALRQVGKPDLFIGPTWVAATPGAVASLLYQGGMEQHNGQIAMHSMPELKIDWDRLMLSRIASERGIKQWVSPSACQGLICSGPAETAVTTIASLLAQLCYGPQDFTQGPLGLSSAYDRFGSNSSRKVLWAMSGAKLAAIRNCGSLEGQPTPADAGAGTEMACFERAAMTLLGVASGSSWLFYPACRMGLGTAHTTGLEARFMADTGRAVLSMQRDEANSLLQKIVALYEDNKKNMTVPEGKSGLELYDMDKIEPLPDYVAVHESAKEKLSSIGLPY